MKLLEYIAALATKVNGIKPTPSMTQAERDAFDACVARVTALEAEQGDLIARVDALEASTAPLTGEISGMPAIEP